MKLPRILVVVACTVFVCAVFVIPISTTQWSVCKYTGSRKIESRSLIRPRYEVKSLEVSELHNYIKLNHPGEFTNNWVPVQRCGITAFGGSILFKVEDARPFRFLRPMDINAYVATLEGNGKKALYDLFRTGDTNTIHSKIEKILNIKN